MTKASKARLDRVRARKAEQAERRAKTVFIGTVEDGSSYLPHPQGGIIVIHPSHPPRWHKPDGTMEEIIPS